MVDSVSWAKYSKEAKNFRLSDSIIRQEQDISFNNFTGHGCDCNVCERVVREPEDLPIRDFCYWEKDDPNDAKILTDDFHLLCSPAVRGYALNERQWGRPDIVGFRYFRTSLIGIVQFHVDQVSDPKIDADPFSNLVLEDEIKDTIEALVCNYAQIDSKVESWGKDFVRDKGEGRIFLLHGSPGVGKT